MGLQAHTSLRNIGYCQGNALRRIISPEISVVGRSVLVPDLGDNIDIAVSIHITGHGIVPSRIISLNHHCNKAGVGRSGI